MPWLEKCMSPGKVHFPNHFTLKLKPINFKLHTGLPVKAPHMLKFCGIQLCSWWQRLSPASQPCASRLSPLVGGWIPWMAGLLKSRHLQFESDLHAIQFESPTVCWMQLRRPLRCCICGLSTNLTCCFSLNLWNLNLYQELMTRLHTKLCKVAYPVGHQVVKIVPSCGIEWAPAKGCWSQHLLDCSTSPSQPIPQ